MTEEKSPKSKASSDLRLVLLIFLGIVVFFVSAMAIGNHLGRKSEQKTVPFDYAVEEALEESHPGVKVVNSYQDDYYDIRKELRYKTVKIESVDVFIRIAVPASDEAVVHKTFIKKR